jgi:large subunit ribosomal protein L24
LYDDSVKKAVTVKIAFHPETGERLRISKKSGRILYKSKSMKHKRDKRGRKRKLGLKDTPYQVVQKVTYLGEDFEAIRREFETFIAEKEAREKHLVFKE